MNFENTTKLLTIYPQLYRELRDFGFECGDGWVNLIWQLSADIELAARVEGLAENTDAWPCVGVVKHKLGDLRMQFNSPVSDSIRNLVDKAGERSTTVCELCAAPCNKVPDLKKVGWMKPLCATCRDIQNLIN